MATHLHTTHDPLIVLLSLVVAIVASYVSLDVAERLRRARGRSWGLWLGAAGLTLGGGIWSMHFIAMLAFEAPVEVTYEVGRTLLSLALAIGSTSIGYGVVAWRSSLTWPRLLAAGMVTGSGVAIMHYTGMAAIMMSARLIYDPVLVGASVLIAIVAATVAFWLSLKLDRTWHKIAASLAMGAAISGMHYTGMAAVHLESDVRDLILPGGSGTSAPLMAVALAIATFLILAIGFLSAITDRRFDAQTRREAEQMQRNERRFETVVSASSHVALLLDETGRITYSSPAIQRILGYDPAKIDGHAFADLVPAHEKQHYEEVIAKVLTKPGTICQADMPIKSAGGHLCHTEMTVTNLLDDPHLNALVIKLHDVTEKKRISEELIAAKERAEAASRAKSSFLANVSHELRTPLNSIIGFSDLLLAQTSGPLNAAYLDFASDINASGKQLLTVINSILEYSRAESGNMRLDNILVDPMVEAELCLRLHQEQVDAKSLQVSLEPFDTRYMLLVDRSKLRQILIHLISNAVKFTPDHGRVRIAAEIDADGSCTLSVQDSGIGMSEEEVTHALQPFAQGQNGLNRSFEGTGLGLPITNALVDLHNGRLRIESARGVGTLVQVFLPADRVKFIGTTQLGIAAS
jgi:PAS domain S-box-containing protein